MNKTGVILDGLNSVALFFSKARVRYVSRRKGVETLVHMLSKVPDFRARGKTTYSLENILTICFLLALKGELTSFYEAAMYVRYRPEMFIRLGLVRKNEIPSHDTFRRVFMYLDANALRDVFLDHMKEFIRKLVDLEGSAKGKKTLISGDGKTFNGSGRIGRLRNVNVFNVFNASSSLCLSSTALSGEESEVPEFQRLLAKFNLSDAVVTGDALHCQRRTSEIICGRRGDFLFKVKENQQELKDEIESCFGSGKFPSVEREFNGCSYSVMALGEGYVGCGWPGQRAYVRMVSHKRRDSESRAQAHYFITSSDSVGLIVEAADNRWQIEDGLHLFKDSFLSEDSCTFTDRNAVKSMATINNVVYGLYRLASSILNDESMGVTKIKYRDDPIRMLALVLPLLEKQNLTSLIKENMRGRRKKQP